VVGFEAGSETLSVNQRGAEGDVKKRMRRFFPANSGLSDGSGRGLICRSVWVLLPLEIVRANLPTRPNSHLDIMFREMEGKKGR
jgi:hypothetical protein